MRLEALVNDSDQILAKPFLILALLVPAAQQNCLLKLQTQFAMRAETN